MSSTRRTQPYRRGTRAPSAALDAMRRGKPAHLPHPSSMMRLAQRKRRSQLGRSVARRRRKL